MTDLTITDFDDAWINSAKPGEKYGDTNAVWLDADGRIGLLRPHIPNLLGETVTDTTGVVRGRDAVPACTITVTPITEGWQAGKVTFTDRPSVDAARAVAVPVAATAAGEPVELPGLAAILQAVADGTEWHGVQLETDSAVGFRLYSVDSGEPSHELQVSLSEAVQQPDGLRPAGGLAVGSAEPILGWDPVDDDDGQTHSRVQVDTPAAGVEPDGVAPDYDSAVVVNVDPQWDLAGVHTLVGAGPHYWRVNLDPTSAVESWSDWAEFTVAALPGLVLDSPVGVFGDPSPTIAAHITGGTLSTWKAFITGPDRSDVRLRSGRRSDGIVWQVPFKSEGRRVVVDGGWLYLRAEDDVDRADAVGEQPFVAGWFPLAFDDDPLVTAPTNLTVMQVAPGDPRHVWRWFHSEVPDAFALYVDGAVIARLEAPDDVAPDGGWYEWTDSGEIGPLRSHTLAVRALEPSVGKSSLPAALIERTHEVLGVWLLPEADIEPIVLSNKAGDDPVADWFAEDAVTTYKTLTGREVDVLHGTPGRVLTFNGQMIDDGRTDVWGTLDRLKALRESANRRARLVWGSESIFGEVRFPQGTPVGGMPNRLLAHNTRFGFVEQVD